MTRPAPLPKKLERLAAGDEIQMGDRLFQAIHAPGHSDGQLIFYDPLDRLMLAGDQVLMKITPNIGLWPNCAPNPLALYLESLSMLQGMEVRLALPGHGPLIKAWHKRITELLAHHEERLAKMYRAGRPEATIWEIAQRIFDFSRFTPHESRFAVAETLAHIQYLVNITQSDNAVTATERSISGMTSREKEGVLIFEAA